MKLLALGDFPGSAWPRPACFRPEHVHTGDTLTTPISPFEADPPSAKRLWRSIAWALMGAVIVLVTIVLPAEFGVDPTRIGRALGLTALNGPTRTLLVEDVLGGNDRYKEVALPIMGEPIPLPNPAVVQIKTTDASVKTFTVRLGVFQETEIKAILDKAQVILYSWKAEGGEVYTDFHGHAPDSGRAFVRYEEQQSGHEGRGSLVAPFAGEHGWFWLNISEKPVTITLEVRGYYRDTIDYGILK